MMRRPALVLLLLLPGCAVVGPDYAGPPGRTGADAFHGNDRPAQGADAVRTEPVPTADLAEWYRLFSDPVLDRIVAAALARSPDLRMAALRVEEARAIGASTRAGLLPTLDAEASYTRQRQAERSPGNFQVPAGSGIPFPVPAGAPGTEYDRFQGGFQASWELDLFGGIRRGVEAGEAEIGAATEAWRDAQVTLLAETASRYFELRAVQRRSDVVRSSIRSQRRTLDLVRERRAAGLASELDVERLAGTAEATAAQLEELAAAERTTAHAIGVLAGQTPEAFLPLLAARGASPVLPRTVGVGTPDDLLRRRPDVRGAERDLAAATARIGVATAEFFPRVSLTGSLGRAGFSFGDLGGPANTFFTAVLPQVRWRILDGGRVRAEVAASRARAEAAAVRYETVALRARREAEDALVRLARGQDRRTRLVAAADRGRRATELAREQYLRGLTSLLEVLDAERTQLQAEDALVQAEAQVALQVVALYRALGGGWETGQREEAGQRR